MLFWIPLYHYFIHDIQISSIILQIMFHYKTMYKNLLNLSIDFYTENLAAYTLLHHYTSNIVDRIFLYSQHIYWIKYQNNKHLCGVYQIMNYLDRHCSKILLRGSLMSRLLKTCKQWFFPHFVYVHLRYVSIRILTIQIITNKAGPNCKYSYPNTKLY
jgi:hypothetical protein